MSRVRKFLALPVQDQWLIVRLIPLLAMIRLGLNLLPAQRLRTYLNRWTTASRRRQELDCRQIDRLMWMIEIASRAVPGATCLTQALAAQVMLGRAGCPSALRLGVIRSSQGEFSAHAWVEFGGRVVIGDNRMLPLYAALPRLD